LGRVGLDWIAAGVVKVESEFGRRENKRIGRGNKARWLKVDDNNRFGDWMREQSSSSGVKKNVWAVEKVDSSGDTLSGVLCDVMRCDAMR
jgi:hypothetical protein